jgi:lysophospholipase
MTSSEAPRRVLVLYTGGTIGMVDVGHGYEPRRGHLATLLGTTPHLHDPAEPRFTLPRAKSGVRVQYELLEYEPLLDSSNMSMADWVRIAGDIERHYADYDGFVVLHGTDTMGFTASALSFMLRGLAKPVILTGSQIPLGQVRTDAIDNVLGALTLAGGYDIPEVALFFHDTLYRGNRARKVDASRLAAFDAPNYPPLADIGIDVTVHWERVLPAPDGGLRVTPTTNANVAALRLFPGIRVETVDNYLQPPLQGLVLETFGAGNAPDDPRLLAAIRAATDRGVVIVAVTQCMRGGVSTAYATGAALARAGVVGGADMTPEAALCKLAYLLSLDLPPEEVRRRVGVPLRGEMTAPGAAVRYSLRERKFADAVAQVLHSQGDGAFEELRGPIAQALFPALLIAAAARGDVANVRAMVLDGADPNAADYDLRTPLHLAAAEGHTDTVEALLELGAATDVRDRWGQTPAEAAEAAQFIDLSARLRRATSTAPARA